MSNHLLKRHIRQYASSKGLNSNDEEGFNTTSYSTRVELLRKSPDGKKWILTLRKIERLRYTDDIRVDWWREEFDAVIVATGERDTPHVPEIKGIEAWGKTFPETIYHSERYRRPEGLAGKVCCLQ